MTAYSSFQVAGDIQPASLDSGDSALFDCDKPLFFFLSFARWLIRNYPGPRILQIAQQTTIKGSNGQILGDSVPQSYSTDIGPYMQSDQLAFPLLACWRKESTYKQKTAAWEEDRCTFDLIYVLPTLDSAQADVLLPMMRAVEQVIRYKLTQSFDPGYTPPGGTAGQSPWDLPFAAIDEIGLERGRHGYLEGAQGLFFPALRISGYWLERDNYYQPGVPKLAGADITGDLVAPDGTRIDPFVQASTQQAPSITKISVSTGPFGGGTVVVFTGALFLNGPQWGPAQFNIMFGGKPAASVSWQSASQVTATTPAMMGTGTVAITLVNPDGQTATSPIPFTFV